MAGLGDIINHVPMLERTPGQALTPDEPSLPLYAAGAIITLCGILGANAALTTPDYGWMTDTLMLSGLGFLFSYGSRKFEIAPRTLDYGFAAMIAILLACFASGQLSPEQLLPAGADRPDLRLLSGLVWGSTVWSWSLRNDNRVIGTTVPAMAVLGMASEIDVNTPVLVCFGVFILTVIFLLIHQNYLQNRSRAAVKMPAPPSLISEMPEAQPNRLLLVQLSQAGLCGLVVLLAGMLVIVPAEVVFSHLSLSQAIRRLAAIQADPNVAGTTQRFSDDDNLSIGTGDAWSASPDVVMRVTPSDGLPHYWRGRTYDVYTGDGWQSSLENDQKEAPAGSSSSEDRLNYPLVSALTPGDPSQPPTGLPLTTKFEARGQTNQFYYATSPRQVIFDGNAARDTSGVQQLRDGRLSLVDGGVVRFPYQIVSVLPPDLFRPGVPERLRLAGTQYPAEVRGLYLAQSSSVQPDDLAFYQQCVAEALQNLPADRHDPLDEAVALRDWVSRRCLYTLTPPSLPEDTDHVHAFLGSTRQGYCDMFASSLAILCRTAGIPARLAVGFAPGDPDGASFNLRAEDKHAWTEIYFPGTGWITFDATSGTRTDGTVPGAASPQKNAWQNRWRLGLEGDWKLVYPLIALILAIASYVAKTEIYDPWRKNLRSSRIPGRAAQFVPAHDLAHPYARLTHSLAKIGLPRHPEETPREYAVRVLPQLPPLEQEWDVSLPSLLVSDLTIAFTEAAYGNPAAPSPPVQPWNSRVADFETAARRVARGRFWQRIFRPGLRTVQPERSL